MNERERENIIADEITGRLALDPITQAAQDQMAAEARKTELIAAKAVESTQSKKAQTALARAKRQRDNIATITGLTLADMPSGNKIISGTIGGYTIFLTALRRGNSYNYCGTYDSRLPHHGPTAAEADFTRLLPLLQKRQQLVNEKRVRR